jgi:mono/diheme cytochrome c family protein
MRLLRSFVLGAALLAVDAAQARDIANGKVIAEIWCGDCHRVDPQLSIEAGRRAGSRGATAKQLRVRSIR